MAEPAQQSDRLRGRRPGPFPPGCPLTEDDVYLFRQGTHYHLHDKLGAHPVVVDGVAGVAFALWAPAARRVSVIGDFNGWSADRHPLGRVGRSGVWAGFVPGVRRGSLYKYEVTSRIGGTRRAKADPFAFRAQLAPATASMVWELDYTWGDGAWMAERGAANAHGAPWSIYELHLGSWRRPAGRPRDWLNYRELAGPLIEHVRRMGFTHVELMPVMEHPFYGSWGYQVTGYFAPSSRYGTPQELMELIDRLHQAGIGVILDWVPSHFPTDAHGLAFFDGTYLYEHADPRRGFHQDWKSSIFNYGRPEVRSFLVSNALYWLTRYHADALRVDGVASMLHLDYSRKPGEWVPNEHGGREDLEAIAFLRQLNKATHEHAPGTITIAEESTSWPLVTRPTWVGGLGFDMKWDMGWMHDTLKYFGFDPVHRKFHHGALTFRQMYAYAENFVLALSHDEVVHGKKSLLSRMPGDLWQRFANLRALYGYMAGLPGKKLLFMGGEIGQWSEWNHEGSIEWHLLDYPLHAGLARWVGDLNRLYRSEPALHELDFEQAGFRWVDCADADQSVFCFLRFGKDPQEVVLVACNLTPVPRHDYRLGAPRAGRWREILNGDATDYGGGGLGNHGAATTEAVACHGLDQSLVLTLPPLAVLFLK